MSVISDLIDKVNDPDLRARLSEERQEYEAKISKNCDTVAVLF